MILGLIGTAGVGVALVGVLNDNYVPLAIVAIALMVSLPVLDKLGYHPQRRHRGWRD